MLRKIKQTFIILGIASGMAAGALFFIHTPDNCRAMVLRDAEKNQLFMDNVARYQVPVSFHAALGGK